MISGDGSGFFRYYINLRGGKIMKRNFQKALSLLLASAMGVSMLAGCSAKEGYGTGATDASGGVSNSGNEPGESSGSGDSGSGELSYTDISKQVYDEALGEFLSYYETAKEKENVSERFALMAIAEAKLLESAVVLPSNADGAYYCISRVAPYTIDYALWGSDNYRYHQALICTEPITAADRAEMKEKWNEVRGTGTYEEWAKSFLEDKGYTLKDEYLYLYMYDPTTWDALSSCWANDCEPTVNTYDGLMEYDCEGTLQPALAVSYTVSDDALTYTFKLREGVEWVDSQGRKVDDVTADDFVAGMQHMLDAQAGLEYLVEGVIANASGYISGEITDFSQVGVKALDEYTVEYTLEAPCTYFLTMLGYNIFAPMSRSYYESQGGRFGLEFDPAASDYTYGLDPNSIAYCGAYLVTNATEKNTIVFKANESYWNYDNINVKTITWLYNDGSDVTKSYNDMKAGNLDGCSLNASTVEMAKEEGLFDEYVYISNTTACTYMSFYNLNRAAFSNTNDTTTVVSAQTEEEAARTNAAMNNVHFRRAISYALDKGTYNAQLTGEALKNNALRNSYTPWNFVELEEDVTVDINGEATTFEAGTYYGVILQAQLDADGMPIKAYDPDADDGNGSGDGYDGWYNPEEAVKELEIAIEELAAEGITIDEDNPIVLDLPYPASLENYTNRANAYKQSLEATLGGKVVVSLVKAADETEWDYAGYYTAYGYEANYDIYDLSGWIPDYGDPCSYLDTLLPDYAGYMTRCFGIY